MTDDSHNNGGNTDYYAIPAGATMLQDIIEHRNMNFAVGNIFKACYRLGEKSGQDVIRDLNKIIWFAERKKARIQKSSINKFEEIFVACGKCGWRIAVDVSGMKTGQTKEFKCTSCGHGPYYYHKGYGTTDGES